MRPNYPDVSRSYLAKHVPLTAKRILDVGCNQGGFGALLKEQRELEVWGVEPDSEAAKTASQRLDKVVEAYFDDRTALPDNYFDAIVFNDSLEHIPYPEDALRVCRRKLAPGGILCICVPNVFHISSLEHLLLQRDWEYEEMGIRDNTHLRFFTRKSLARLLAREGYEVLAQEGVNREWWEKGKVLRRLLFRVFPRFTEEMRYLQFVTSARLMPGS